jgi:N-acetyl-beta-hexosaminidase
LRGTRYSLAEVGALQGYAAARGVRLVAEVDTPGHGAARHRP